MAFLACQANFTIRICTNLPLSASVSDGFTWVFLVSFLAEIAVFFDDFGGLVI